MANLCFIFIDNDSSLSSCFCISNWKFTAVEWAMGNNVKNVGNLTAFKSEQVGKNRNIAHPTGLILGGGDAFFR